MLADTLQSLERSYLFQLLAWAMASVLIGTVMLAWIKHRSWQTVLLQRFSLQTALWGVMESVVALLLLTRLSPRDLAGAIRLDRMVWLSIGLEIGLVLVGFAFVWSGSRAQRAALVGTGGAIVLQGAALATLHLALAAQLSR